MKGSSSHWQRNARECRNPLVIVPDQDEPFGHCRNCQSLVRIRHGRFLRCRVAIRNVNKYLKDLALGLVELETALGLWNQMQNGTLHLTNNTMMVSLEQIIIKYLLDQVRRYPLFCT